MDATYDLVVSGQAAIGSSDVKKIVRDVFGRRVRGVQELGGEIDRNFRVVDEDGTPYVLKVAGAHTSEAEIDLENAVLERLAAADLGVAVPSLVASGRVALDGGEHAVRLVTWVPGEPIRELPRRGPGVLRELGGVAARIVQALQGFDHPAAHRTHHWDVARCGDAVALCLPAVEDAERAAMVDRVIAWLPDSLDDLPRGVVHQDLNDDNVRVAPDAYGTQHVVGVIDVGDAMHTAVVAELAVAGAYAMRAQPDPVGALCAVVEGFHERRPLRPDEANVVFRLAAARLCVNVTTWSHRHDADPADAYAVTRMEGIWDTIAKIAATDPAYADARVRAVCGFEPHERHVAVARWLGEHGAPAFVDAREPAATWGSIDLDRSGRRREANGPRTVLLGTRHATPEGTPVFAPWSGVVERSDPSGGWVIVRHEPPDGPVLWSSVTGVSSSLRAGHAVAAGRPIGRASAHGLLVQLACSVPPDGPLPTHAAPDERAAALSTFPDPQLTGRPAAPTVENVLEVRARRFARSQRSYYRRPMRLVRGRGVWLTDEDGLDYLDAVNNVTHVGHGHPAIVEAAHRQMQALNTNSRFVYTELAEYSERLASLLPPPLEVVYLVCTGSEANDLALRIVRTVTGREHMVCIAGAYHGNTTAVTDVSPNRYRMAGRDVPPATIEVPQPNRYRGPFGYDDPDAGAKYAALASEALASPPAGVIAESLMGTGGQIVHPPGYLAGLFAAVRSAGGLCIADEVQVGFGRMGTSFWCFEGHGVVPDVVTMGKPIGNGHPISAVVTTREIADAFDEQGRYFNTFGGNPVSCAIGMAVLDVIEREGLQAHAGRVGPYLIERLHGLAKKHAIVGDVRGEGLYAGVELVRDPDTKEPAAEEALLISERMKDEGVIVYPNGDHENVLKLKPPMVFTQEHADLFVDTLDEVLSTGW